MGQKNNNSVYVFTRAKAGEFAYEIDDHDFNKIYSATGNVLHADLRPEYCDKKGRIWAEFCDYEAIYEGLKYIMDNRGKGPIPTEPAVTVYTSYKEHPLILYGIDKACKSKPYKAKLDNLIHVFQDALNNKKTTNLVRFNWVPENFKNKIKDTKKSFS